MKPSDIPGLPEREWHDVGRGVLCHTTDGIHHFVWPDEAMAEVKTATSVEAYLTDPAGARVMIVLTIFDRNYDRDIEARLTAGESAIRWARKRLNLEASDA